MIRIGLTGSIGSGKSSIAREAARSLGIPVFDADQTVHDLYAHDEELKQAIIGSGNADILTDGAIDRKKLARYIETVDQIGLWERIEALVHAAVWREYRTFLDKHEAAGEKYIIADVPLLFEKGTESYFDYTINVFLPYEEQKRRALARETPKLTEAQFEHRYKLFMPIEQRNKKADFVIDNSGELAASMLQLRLHLSNMQGPVAPSPALATTFNQAVVYVGSFDPMTLGHIDVVKSASKMPYSKIYVAVGVNPQKKPMFTTEERIAMIEREMDRDVRPYLMPGQQVIVTSYEGLTVDFMRRVGASLCVRGLRGIRDLEEESDLAAVNRGLYADNLDEPGAEQFSQAYFATSRPELRHVSSSFARAIAASGRDLALLQYVSADVAAKMIAKRDAAKTAEAAVPAADKPAKKPKHG